MLEGKIVWKNGKVETIVGLSELRGAEEKNLCLVLSPRDLLEDSVMTSGTVNNASISPDADMRDFVNVASSLIDVAKENGKDIRSVCVVNPTTIPYHMAVSKDYTINYIQEILDIQEIDSALGNVLAKLPENAKNLLKSNIDEANINNTNIRKLMGHIGTIVGRLIVKELENSPSLRDAFERRAELYEPIHQALVELKKQAKVYLYVGQNISNPDFGTCYGGKYLLLGHGISKRVPEIYDALILDYPLQVPEIKYGVDFSNKIDLKGVLQVWSKRNVTSIVTNDDFIIAMLVGSARNNGTMG